MSGPDNPVETAPSASAKRSGKRQWLFRLIAMLGVPALLLGVLELGLRLGNYGYPANYLLEKDIDGQPMYVENAFFGRHFFPKGLARIPESFAFPVDKPPGTFRIFILGESAAMGYPESSLSFGRVLQVLLRESYPDMRFEVINTAMTAINSHVIVPIAQECARCQPDLFVIYMGNNEVVGPFGTAGVLGRFSGNLSLIRASIGVKSLRTGQLIGNALQRLTRPAESPGSWEGMIMFANAQVRADDPRMPAVHANFARNLEDICQAGQSAGAKVLVCTVGANLRDFPPFVSVHAAALSAEQLQKWQTAYDDGARLELAGDHAGAIELFRQAIAIDETAAEAHFRMGRCLRAMKEPAEARRQFVAARDLDALRFRVDSTMNTAIRQIAQGREADGVYLADVEAALDMASADGVAGDDLFYEHVHMTFAGNYRTATTIFDQIARILPTAPSNGPLPMQTCKDRLAVSDWKIRRGLEKIVAITSEVPFTHQIDSDVRLRMLTTENEVLRQRLRADNLGATLAIFRRALEQSPDDVDLHRDLAEALMWRGDYAEAVPHLKFVLKRLPHQLNGYFRLAFAMKNLRKYAEALALCDNMHRLDPEHPGADTLKGAIFMEMSNFPEASAAFRRAIALDPDDYNLRDNLGLALAANGQFDDAIAAHLESLRRRPDNAKAHVHLGNIYRLQKKLPLAVEQFSAAVRIDPHFADGHVGLGITYVQLERYDKALEQYRAALASNPRSAVLHLEIAKVLARQGKNAEAVAAAQEALRLRPDWQDAAGALDELRRRAGPNRDH